MIPISTGNIDLGAPELVDPCNCRNFAPIRSLLRMIADTYGLSF
jgi:hypothetical protein